MELYRQRDKEREKQDQDYSLFMWKIGTCHVHGEKSLTLTVTGHPVEEPPPRRECGWRFVTNQLTVCLLSLFVQQQMYVDDESFIDTATRISGSGPAYIFLLMEAMMDCGVHMGFPRDKAATLVYHTMLGSTLYAMETGEHPAILRNMVTSPSGTTASAIYELENGRFRSKSTLTSM